MSESAFPRVDALFAGEPPPAPQSARRRIRRLALLLMLATPFNLLAIPCFTGVPGALLTLWAFLLADGESARIEAGQIAEDEVQQLRRLQMVAAGMLYFCVASFVVQVWLLGSALYQTYLTSAVQSLMSAAARVWAM